MENIQEYRKVNQDWYLTHLTNMVRNGLEIGITLNVNGAVISGTLISNHTYFKELSELYHSIDNEWAQIFSESAYETYEEYKEMNEKEDADSNQVAYIHLRNAKVFSANGAIPNEGVLWRGKLVNVDGFSMGNLG